MKTTKLSHLILFLLFSISFIQSNSAVHSERAEIKKEKPVKAAKKKGKIKDWVKKIVSKRLLKTTSDSKIKKFANLAIIFGVAAVVLLVITVLFGIQASVAWLFIPTAIFAILGDIFAILTLRKSRHDKKSFQIERRRGVVGLVLSLLVGLLPLALLLLVLISL